MVTLVAILAQASFGLSLKSICSSLLYMLRVPCADEEIGQAEVTSLLSGRVYSVEAAIEMADRTRRSTRVGPRCKLGTKPSNRSTLSMPRVWPCPRQ